MEIYTPRYKQWDVEEIKFDVDFSHILESDIPMGLFKELEYRLGQSYPNVSRFSIDINLHIIPSLDKVTVIRFYRKDIFKCKGTECLYHSTIVSSWCHFENILEEVHLMFPKV